MELIPNAAGARLLAGQVLFDDQPPCAPHVALAEYPIIAFQYDGKRCVPVTLTGPVRFWGELRVSTSGALVYGITVGTGIETPDGARCASMAAFRAHVVAAVCQEVREVRKAKNWPEERLPKEPPDDESGPAERA